MSYKHTSNQSGDASQSRARTFLVERGFIVLEPSSRDAIYDCVIDRGDGIFETAQIKTLKGNSLAKRTNRKGETVSKQGKIRNSVDYAEEGIHWLIGVGKNGEIYPYHIEQYKQYDQTTFSVKKYPPLRHFPRNENIKSNNKISKEKK